MLVSCGGLGGWWLAEGDKGLIMSAETRDKRSGTCHSMHRPSGVKSTLVENP